MGASGSATGGRKFLLGRRRRDGGGLHMGGCGRSSATNPLHTSTVTPGQPQGQGTRPCRKIWSSGRWLSALATYPSVPVRGPVPPWLIQYGSPTACFSPAGVAGELPAKLPAVATGGVCRCGNSFESPKSVRAMCPSPPMRMFSGLRSR